MIRKSLAVGITLLFIVSVISPLVFGNNVELKQQKQVSNLVEPPGIEWKRIYRLYLHELSDVLQTTDGGYISAGRYGNRVAGYLIKTDAFGHKKWERVYGEPDDEMETFESIQQTSDGGFIITGLIDYNYPSWCNIWLVKTDSNGNEEWSKTLSNGRGFSVQQTTDGGYIIGGDDFPYTPSVLLKTDCNGNIEWRKEFFDTSHSSTCTSVVQTLDGGFIATGYSRDAYLIKIDEEGNLLWNITLRGQDFDVRGQSVGLTNDGGYFIMGHGYNNSFNNRIAFLIKTDENGSIIFDVSFGDSTDEYYAYDCQQTSDGGYVIGGMKSGASILIKTDSNGNKEWEITFSSHRYINEYIVSVQQTCDDGYIIAEFSQFDLPPYEWGRLIKLSPENRVKITKPEKAMYFFNNKVIPLFRPLIIGPIDIEVDISDVGFNVEGVDFYIDGQLKYTDMTEPYNWTWDNIMFLKHIIEVKAYGNNNCRSGNSILVRKFF